jgi:DNA-binding IclR family transcriptional regulator
LLGGTEVPVAWLGSRDAEQAHALLDMKSPPIWTTASGRALLGCLAPAQRTRVLPPEPYPQLNQGTPTSWAGLRQLIRAGAKDGLFFEYGEVAKDIWCCAVPLEPGDSGEVLALSVACIGEPTGYRRARIHHALSREAHNLYVSLAGAR